MTAINTNVNSLVTQSALRRNEVEMSTAMTRLSTGKRINTAADDAAGMAIASRMTAQIKGLNQAVRNAQDATSMVQTADGATIEISNMLQRMRELSVQSANGTNTSADRAALNTEFQALMLEVDRVAHNTQWNGRNVLDGSVDLQGPDTTVTTTSSSTTAVTNQNVSGDTGNVTLMASVDSASGWISGLTNLADENLAVGDVLTYNAAGGAGLQATGGVALTTGDQVEVFNVNGSGAVQIGLSGGSAWAGYADSGSPSVGNDAQWFGMSGDVTTTTSTTTTVPGEKFVTYQIGANENQKVTMTFNDFRTDSANGVYGGAIDTLNISSDSAADTALGALTDVINKVNSQRATYGSTVNRLGYAIDNLANVSLNAEASRSRVQDADYGSETSQLARTQIIQQAGTAMLAQANALPQTVLALLK